jgi:hypothetical protein
MARAVVAKIEAKAMMTMARWKRILILVWKTKFGKVELSLK